MTIHIQGPWRTDAAGGFPLDIHDQDNTLVARVQPSPAAHNVARRIVACVNACQGIPADELERGSVVILAGATSSLWDGKPGTLVHLQAQRDELLAALEWIARVNAVDYEYQQVARSAIAKAKGGAA